MRMPTTNAYNLIEGFEARRLTVYLDIKGVPTGGVGHTGKDLPPVGTTLTAAQVELWFSADVAEAVRTIERHVPADVLAAIPDVSYDALVSFVFNVGEQAFVDPKSGKQTNFSKTLNDRRWDEVDDRMRDWVYANRVKVPGLVNRRAAESAQWNAGLVPALPSRLATVALPTVVHKPSQTGVVPDAPPKKPVVNTRGFAGFVTTAVGTVVGAAPDLIASGNQMRSMAGDIKFLSIVGAVIVVIGIALGLWEKIHARAKSGA